MDALFCINCDNMLVTKIQMSEPPKPEDEECLTCVCQPQECHCPEPCPHCDCGDCHCKKMYTRQGRYG